MLKRAVFLDRDGTINEEVNYLDDPDKLVLIPNSAEAINLLNNNSFKVVIATNQAGIARGYFTEQRLHQIHKKMKDELIKSDAFVNGIYYCPHHPDHGDENYRQICKCRKPQIGMIKQAASDLNLDLSNSYAIGDTVGDLMLGKRAGLKSIFVLTGHGKDHQHQISADLEPDYIAADLFAAVNWILAREK